MTTPGWGQWLTTLAYGNAPVVAAAAAREPRLPGPTGGPSSGSSSGRSLHPGEWHTPLAGLYRQNARGVKPPAPPAVLPPSAREGVLHACPVYGISPDVAGSEKSWHAQPPRPHRPPRLRLLGLICQWPP